MIVTPACPSLLMERLCPRSKFTSRKKLIEFLVKVPGPLKIFTVTTSVSYRVALREILATL
jgi:hypothetical protein